MDLPAFRLWANAITEEIMDLSTPKSVEDFVESELRDSYNRGLAEGQEICIRILRKYFVDYLK